MINFYRTNSRTCKKVTHRSLLVCIVNCDRIAKKNFFFLFDEQDIYYEKHTLSTVFRIVYTQPPNAQFCLQSAMIVVYIRDSEAEQHSTAPRAVYMTSMSMLCVVVSCGVYMYACGARDSSIFFFPCSHQRRHCCTCVGCPKNRQQNRKYGKNSQVYKSQENENKSNAIVLVSHTQLYTKCQKELESYCRRRRRSKK